MARFLESLGLFRGAPDPRPTRDIDGDIEDELRFHVEQRERENLTAGMNAAEARADAERRFGDFERIRGDCRRVQLGERIVLQRINFVILGCLLTAVTFVGWSSWSSQREARDVMERMRAEVAQLNASLRSESSTKPAPNGPSPTDEAGRNFVTLDHVLEDLAGTAKSERAAHTNAFPEEETSDEMWLSRFRECGDDWRGGLAVAQRLADECSCERAVDVLDADYAYLSLAHREQLFKPFVFHGGKPCALRVLHFGATDPEPSVRARAFTYLRDYAYRDFGEDYEGYLAWYHEFGAQSVAEVLRRGASDFVARARSTSPGEVDTLARAWRTLDFRVGKAAGVDLVGVFRAGGAVDLARDWIRSSNVDRRLTGLAWLGALEPSEAELRDLVLPVLGEPISTSGVVFHDACVVIGRESASWAVPDLLAVLERRIGDVKNPATIGSVTEALVATRDSRALPYLVGWIAADDSPATIEGIGAYGLQSLTGVAYDPSHDGAWWRAWWEKNSGSLPEAIRGTPLPALKAQR